MTRLAPWSREREHIDDAEGYPLDAVPEYWVRRPTVSAIDFAIVLWHSPLRGWLLRLGPQHGCRLIEVQRFYSLEAESLAAALVYGRIPDASALCLADAILIHYDYTLENT